MITIPQTRQGQPGPRGAMTDTDSAELDRLQEAAEEVRSHLVVLRGGAPFLSPLDGRLLLEWLEAGISVPAILRALEHAAAKRREKRVRAPLSLRSVRSRVTRSRHHVLPQEEAGSLTSLVEALRGETDPWVQQVAEELAGLQGSGDDLARQALAVVRRFHQEAWDRADRDSLLRLATEELQDLRDKLDDKQWGAALEEVARDKLRARQPLLSATAIWDSLSP